jgi:hypothetical protein
MEKKSAFNLLASFEKFLHALHKTIKFAIMAAKPTDPQGSTVSHARTKRNKAQRTK